MPSVVKLESLVNEDPVEILQLDGGMVTVGRDPENGIVVDSDSVSRRHCSFFEVHGHWFFRDFDSTNGSWINGVKVTSGQVRLLRDGDFIQLANFPMRISEVAEGSNGTLDASRMPPSLLVFSEDRFESEFPFSEPMARFAIGGPDGQFSVDGVTGEEPQVEVVFTPPHLELIAAGAGLPVIVNGLVVGGVTVLSDRDEIDVGGLKIIVNDPASAEMSKEARMRAAMATHAKSRNASSAIMARPGQHDQIGTDWESESSRRRELLGRKFVFGAAPVDPHNVTGTMTFAGNTGQLGFEVSSSQRFSKAAIDAHADARRPGMSEGMLGVIGFVVFVCILGALIYFFALL